MHHVLYGAEFIAGVVAQIPKTTPGRTIYFTGEIQSTDFSAVQRECLY